MKKLPPDSASSSRLLGLFPLALLLLWMPDALQLLSRASLGALADLVDHPCNEDFRTVISRSSPHVVAPFTQETSTGDFVHPSTLETPLRGVPASSLLPFGEDAAAVNAEAFTEPYVGDLLPQQPFSADVVLPQQQRLLFGVLRHATGGNENVQNVASLVVSDPIPLPAALPVGLPSVAAAPNAAFGGVPSEVDSANQPIPTVHAAAVPPRAATADPGSGTCADLAVTSAADHVARAAADRVAVGGIASEHAAADASDPPAAEPVVSDPGVLDTAPDRSGAAAAEGAAAGGATHPVAAAVRNRWFAPPQRLAARDGSPPQRDVHRDVSPQRLAFRGGSPPQRDVRRGFLPQRRAARDGSPYQRDVRRGMYADSPLPVHQQQDETTKHVTQEQAPFDDHHKKAQVTYSWTPSPPKTPGPRSASVALLPVPLTEGPTHDGVELSGVQRYSTGPPDPSHWRHEQQQNSSPPSGHNGAQQTSEMLQPSPSDEIQMPRLLLELLAESVHKHDGSSSRSSSTTEGGNSVSSTDSQQQLPSFPALLLSLSNVLDELKTPVTAAEKEGGATTAAKAVAEEDAAATRDVEQPTRVWSVEKLLAAMPTSAYAGLPQRPAMEAGAGTGGFGRAAEGCRPVMAATKGGAAPTEGSGNQVSSEANTKSRAPEHVKVQFSKVAAESGTPSSSAHLAWIIREMMSRPPFSEATAQQERQKHTAAVAQAGEHEELRSDLPPQMPGEEQQILDSFLFSDKGIRAYKKKSPKDRLPPERKHRHREQKGENPGRWKATDYNSFGKKEKRHEGENPYIGLDERLNLPRRMPKGDLSGIMAAVVNAAKAHVAAVKRAAEEGGGTLFAPVLVEHSLLPSQQQRQPQQLDLQQQWRQQGPEMSPAATPPWKIPQLPPHVTFVSPTTPLGDAATGPVSGFSGRGTEERKQPLSGYSAVDVDRGNPLVGVGEKPSAPSEVAGTPVQPEAQAEPDVGPKKVKKHGDDGKAKPEKKVKKTEKKRKKKKKNGKVRNAAEHHKVKDIIQEAVDAQPFQAADFPYWAEGQAPQAAPEKEKTTSYLPDKADVSTKTESRPRHKVTSHRDFLDGQFVVSTEKEKLGNDLGVRKRIDRPDIVHVAWKALKAMAAQTSSSGRLLYLRLMKKLPWSWDRFVKELPRVDDSMIPEFRSIRRQLESRSSEVLIVDSPSSALKHLVLTERPEAAFTHGLVIKARVVDTRRTAKSASEINGLLRVVPKSPFMLSAYAAWVSGQGFSSHTDRLLEGKQKVKAGDEDVGGGGNKANDRPRLLKKAKKKEKLWSQPVIYVVTPRARGDIDDYIHEKRYPIDVEMTAAEMLYALYLLHSAGFIHRDIKLLNYFVTFEGHVVLGDFDGVWPAGIPVSTKDHLLYTKGYLAPEVDINKKYADYTEKSDIYALGICFKELHEAKPKMRNGEVFKDLYRRMTAMNPEKRPTALQAMQHQFFREVNFSSLELLAHRPPLPGKFVVSAGFYG